MSVQDSATPKIKEAVAVVRPFVASVPDHLGSDVEFVVLYGSRAKGTARPDSDYDAAIFVKDGVNVWQTLRIASDLAYPYVLKGQDIRPLVEPVSRWKERSDILNHIRSSGIRVE